MGSRRRKIWCSNPFEIHKHKRQLSVIKIYPEHLKLAQKYLKAGSSCSGVTVREGMVWSKETKICVRCRITVGKVIKEHEISEGTATTGHSAGSDTKGRGDYRRDEEEMRMSDDGGDDMGQGMFDGHEPEEEDDEFAIIPSPPPASLFPVVLLKSIDLSLSSCLFCGSGRIVRPSKYMKNGTVGDSLCKLLGLSQSTHAARLASGPYCKPCEEYGEKMIKTLLKLEEIEREIEGMREEVKRKMVQALEKDNKEDEVEQGIRKRLAKDLGLGMKPDDTASSSATNIKKESKEGIKIKKEKMEDDEDYDEPGGDELMANNDDDYDEDIEESKSDSRRDTTGPYSLRQKRRKVGSTRREDMDEEDGDGHGDPDYDIEKDTGKKTRISMGFEKKPESFPCPVCGFNFVCEMIMRAHVLKRHEGCEKPWRCTVPGCDKQFKRRTKLRTHEQTHQGPYICTYCGKSFSHMDSLQNHETTVHLGGGKRFKCDECEYETPTGLKQVEIHKAKFHSGAFKCDICGKGLQTEAVLQEHIRIKHPIVLKCSFPDCNKSCYSKPSLAQHEKEVHNKEFDYQCNICSEKIVSMNALRLHISLKHQEKRLQCDICERRFAKVNLLNMHIRRKHTGNFKLYCQICGKGFFTKASMDKHHYNVHIEGKGKTRRKKGQKQDEGPHPEEGLTLPNANTQPPPPHPIAFQVVHPTAVPSSSSTTDDIHWAHQLLNLN